MEDESEGKNSLPEIVVGKTAFRVERVSARVIVAIGPRGGRSTLVQNIHNPALYGAINGAMRGLWFVLGNGGFSQVYLH